MLVLGVGTVGGTTSMVGALVIGAAMVGAVGFTIVPDGGSDVVFFGAGAGAGAGDGAGIFFGGVVRVSPAGTGATTDGAHELQLLQVSQQLSR